MADASAEPRTEIEEEKVSFIEDNDEDYSFSNDEGTGMVSSKMNEMIEYETNMIGKRRRETRMDLIKVTTRS